MSDPASGSSVTMTYPPMNPQLTQGSTARPDLSQPVYGATFGQAVRRFFTKYATFTGRASRSEYWWAALAGAAVSVVISLIGLATGSDVAAQHTSAVESVLSDIFSVVTLIPSLAIISRRLHDTGRSSWWFLLLLIPLLGAIVLIVLLTLPTTGPNQYDVRSGGGYPDNGGHLGYYQP